MCDDCFADGEIDATVFATMHDIDRRDDNYATGAAVMAGIIGMFEAIRSRFPLCSACNTCLRPREKGWWVCDDCGTWRQPYYNRAKGTWA